MSAFGERLRAGSGDLGDQPRRWIFVPYDQLSHAVGPLARERPSEAGIVLVESPEKAARRPYHRQKLALLLTNLRHFAIEQAQRGVAVRHVVSDGGYASALEPLTRELGPLAMAEAAERELRAELAPLVERGALEVEPFDGWLTTPEDFRASQKGASRGWRMDRFYAHVRKRTGYLMDPDGKPEGGKYSFDAENRKPWRGEPPAPALPTYRPDDVTKEVCELVRSRFGDHPGELDEQQLPASTAQVERALDFAMESCLPHFGPFEDALSDRESNLFHTRLSALMNLCRLSPRQVVEAALATGAPLASREGFLRQVLGWREFVRHVHRETDGFRELPEGCGPDHLGADRPLPPAFWPGAPSGLRCLDRTVERVWREGQSHHISRLMVLGNLATLLGISARELSDWFWVAYTDAFDWVVEPNVLGMATFSLGELFTTKPYVSGAAYLDRMGDHCGPCAFDPKRDCPVTPLYWAFLERHRDRLADNPRVKLPLASLGKRSPDRRRADRRVAERLVERLGQGLPSGPTDLGDGSSEGPGR